MNFRERVAVSFMGANLVATVSLGGAVAYELGRSSRAVVTARL